MGLGPDPCSLPGPPIDLKAGFSRYNSQIERPVGRPTLRSLPKRPICHPTAVSLHRAVRVICLTQKCERDWYHVTSSK
jgi:hypothetical protein